MFFTAKNRPVSLILAPTESSKIISHGTIAEILLPWPMVKVRVETSQMAEADTQQCSMRFSTIFHRVRGQGSAISYEAVSRCKRPTDQLLYHIRTIGSHAACGGLPNGSREVLECALSSCAGSLW